MPSPGLIRGLRPASGPGIRDDGGVSAGYAVPVFYDSLIAKLIAWADDAGRGDRADGARARRVPGARDPDDDPVLPLADAPAGLQRAGATTRRISTACWPTRQGRAFQRVQQRRRGPDRDRRGARRVPGARAREPTAPRRAPRSRWKQAARREALRG